MRGELLLASLAVVQQPPSAPPAWILADHNPGPWVVFLDGGRPLPAEAGAILDRVREQLSPFPGRALALCLEGGPGSRREEMRRLETVRRALRARGFARIVVRGQCGTPRDLQRPLGVTIVPAIG